MSSVMSWLGVLAMNARGKGKTTAVARAAASINGILVVRNKDEAKRVNREHGVLTHSADSAIGADPLRGMPNTPIFFDPDAVMVLLHQADKETARARAEGMGMAEAAINLAAMRYTGEAAAKSGMAGVAAAAVVDILVKVKADLADRKHHLRGDR